MQTYEEVMKQVPEQVDRVLSEIEHTRHQLHQQPELALNEVNTAALVRARLEAADIGMCQPLLGTDVIGLLSGARPGPHVVLRADLDALPLQEKTGLPYRSACDGRMHACGHDGHTAMLLGVALVLQALRDRLPGSVKFVFQPGEEVVAAGRDLVQKGALRDPVPNAVFAVHCWPGVPLGAVASRPGPVLAAAEFFRIVIRGKGAHGSKPEDSVDPILTAARVVDGLQAVVSRRFSPLDSVVVSVCRINSGTNSNIIPDTAEIEGTARHLNLEVGRRLPGVMEQIVRGVCESMGATYEFHYSGAYLPTVNHESMVVLGRKVARERLGPDAWVEMTHPSMGGEDFAYYIRDYPGALFLLGMGAGSAPLHSPLFDFNDKALKSGITFLACAAIEALFAPTPPAGG